MNALAVDVMIPARKSEKRGDDLRTCAISAWRVGALFASDGLDHRRPALVAVLTRKRMLHVAQGRTIRGSSGTERSQAALRFFLQVVERSHETPSFRCAWRPLTAGRKKAS